jgi:hypothetical protein
MKHIHSQRSTRVGAQNTLRMRLGQPSMRQKNETKTFKGMVSLGCKLDEERKI